MPPYECRVRSLICVYWITWFAVCCVRVNFVVLGTEGKSVSCLFYKIYHKTDHPLHEYLHHFTVARNARASAT